jgi:enterochelin esterase-like enzyme
MKDKPFPFLILAALILLTSCAPPSENPPISPTGEQNSVETDRSTARPTISKTPTPDLSLAATQTATACLAKTGEITELELESEILDNELIFRVYTPPCYAEYKNEAFPVLYLIHGQTFTDDQWDRLGADEMADQLIISGDLAPFIIVMPFDHSSQQPSIDHFGEAFIEELLPWIDENYRTIQDRDSRAVGGLSRGASWAFHFALLHPELFGAVGGHSPPIFVEDAPHIRGWLNGIPAELMPRIWLDIGERDQQVILESAKWFADILDDFDIPHEWHLFAGNHDEVYWSRHVELYLRWYAQFW